MVQYGKGLLIGVAYASSVGGIATLTGTPTNLVFTGFIDDHFHGELFDKPGSDRRGRCCHSALPFAFIP